MRGEKNWKAIRSFYNGHDPCPFTPPHLYAQYWWGHTHLPIDPRCRHRTQPWHRPQPRRSSASFTACFKMRASISFSFMSKNASVSHVHFSQMCVSMRVAPPQKGLALAVQALHLRGGGVFNEDAHGLPDDAVSRRWLCWCGALPGLLCGSRCGGGKTEARGHVVSCVQRMFVCILERFLAWFLETTSYIIYTGIHTYSSVFQN